MGGDVHEGYKDLLIAVIKQWKQDGKPKHSEKVVKDYAAFLLKSNLVKASTVFKTVVLPENISQAISKLEKEEELW